MTVSNGDKILMLVYPCICVFYQFDENWWKYGRNWNRLKWSECHALQLSDSRWGLGFGPNESFLFSVSACPCIWLKVVLSLEHAHHNYAKAPISYEDPHPVQFDATKWVETHRPQTCATHKMMLIAKKEQKRPDQEYNFDDSKISCSIMASSKRNKKY